MSIPEIEKKNAREIKAFQGKALINMLQYVKKNSRFYQYHFRRHGINTDKIKNLDDLIHIPITRKEDLQSGADDFICVSRDNIIDYITTSGTSGDPVTYAMTDRDLDRLAYNEYLGFRCADCTHDEIFQLMTTIDRRFMAGLGFFFFLKRIKMEHLSVGKWNFGNK